MAGDRRNACCDEGKDWTFFYIVSVMIFLRRSPNCALVARSYNFFFLSFCGLKTGEAIFLINSRSAVNFFRLSMIGGGGFSPFIKVGPSFDVFQKKS